MASLSPIPERLVKASLLQDSTLADFLVELSENSQAGSHQNSWGLTIFRTVFTPASDALFPLALKRIDDYARDDVKRLMRAPLTPGGEHYDAELEAEIGAELLGRLHHSVVEDRALDGASVDTVAAAFDAWVEEHGDPDSENPRYRFALVLDQQALEETVQLPDPVTDKLSLRWFVSSCKGLTRWCLSDLLSCQWFWAAPAVMARVLMFSVTCDYDEGPVYCLMTELSVEPSVFETTTSLNRWYRDCNKLTGYTGRHAVMLGHFGISAILALKFYYIDTRTDACADVQSPRCRVRKPASHVPKYDNASLLKMWIWALSELGASFRRLTDRGLLVAGCWWRVPRRPAPQNEGQRNVSVKRHRNNTAQRAAASHLPGPIFPGNSSSTAATHDTPKRTVSDTLPCLGASPKELLIEACRRNNTDLLTEVLAGRPDDEITTLLNRTTTVMGNHLRTTTTTTTTDEIIDLLLDQPNFECDPVNRLEGDTPLHTAIRWLNAEPHAQRAFGAALVEMMLEAGSNPRLRNKGGLTALQLVDPTNTELRALIDKHLYASQNAGDFVESVSVKAPPPGGAPPPPPPVPGQAPPLPGQAPPALLVEEFDEDAEFSGSDDEERAEWERRKRERAQR
ncbi:hypothetical protein PWT90_06591 [Aphanocladium album]|nr:hypothetical protein PWT90_06591 [Aphanocladium album]